MATSEERHYILVELKKASQLKTDLNKGIAALLQADQSHFRPHLCLNGATGIKTIQKIAASPEQADTEVLISDQIKCDGDDAWLNVSFSVYLDEMSSESHVMLTPRQTAYVVMNLPPESRQAAAAKVEAWYQKHFLQKVQKGLDKITKQFKEGDLFLADTRRNRIFDIHGDGNGHDTTPYTEWDIIGSELFLKLFFGHTCFHVMAGEDGYNRIDDMLAQLDRERVDAFQSLRGALQILHPR